MNYKDQNAKMNSPPFRNRLDEEVLRWTNVERRKNGLNPFRSHPRLRRMAIIHSEQMLDHCFCDHENPYEPMFRTMDDRLRYVMGDGFAGFHAYAENIALCTTLKHQDTIVSGTFPILVRIEHGVPHIYDKSGNELRRCTVEEFAQAIVTGWMNSPGHRKNILNPIYEYLGCGCAGYQQDLGNGAVVSYYYLTQNFGGGEITVP